MPITMMSVARGVGAWFWPSLWAKAVLDVRSAAARVLVESRNLDMTIPVLVERPPPGRRTARTGLRGSFDAGWSVCIGKCGRDRKSVLVGKSVSVRVALGGRRLIKKKNCM